MKTLTFISSGIGLIALIVSALNFPQTGSYIKENQIIEDILHTVNEENHYVDLSVADDAFWTPYYSEKENTLKLNYLLGDASLIIDMDDATDDVKEAGISVMINGELYSSSSAHLLSPVYFDPEFSNLKIQVDGGEVNIYYKGGTMGQMAGIENNKGLKMYASIEIVDGQLNLDFSGLYKLASSNNEPVISNHRQGVVEYNSSEDTMLNDVEFFYIPSVNGNSLLIDSQARAVKMEQKSNELLLDFSPSYTEGGQQSVATMVVINTLIDDFNLVF